MKYKDWLDIWLENYIKPDTKPRTYDCYRKIIDNHVATDIGEYALDELTPILLQAYTARLLLHGNKITGEGLSSSSVNLIITIIQNSLKTAHRMGVSDSYIAQNVKRPKTVLKSEYCFSLAEQHKIERAVMLDKRPKMLGIILCLYTGLRIGELLALNWSDVDLKKSVISVNKTCYERRDDGYAKHCAHEPKTQASKRIVPIPKQLLPMLCELKRKKTCQFVISQNQAAVGIRSYQQSFALLLSHLKIPHKGFHALRHTFATRALECGMDVKTLSEILGHKNASITLNRYAHSLIEHKHRMMNRLGKLLVE